jgi:hypothetical protein
MVPLEQKPRGIIAMAEGSSSSISPQDIDATRDATDYDICPDSSVVLVSIIELAGIGLIIDTLRKVKHSIARSIKYRSTTHP